MIFVRAKTAALLHGTEPLGNIVHPENTTWLLLVRRRHYARTHSIHDASLSLSHRSAAVDVQKHVRLHCERHKIRPGLNCTPYTHTRICYIVCVCLGSWRTSRVHADSRYFGTTQRNRTSRGTAGTVIVRRTSSPPARTDLLRMRRAIKTHFKRRVIRGALNFVVTMFLAKKTVFEKSCVNKIFV